MAGVKVTMQFGMDKYTWTEAHWYLLSQTPQLTLAQAPANQLAQLRVALLGNGATLQRVRLSLLGGTRNALDLLPPFIPTTPVWPADPTGLIYGASRAFTSLVLQLQDNVGHQKNLYVAGCPNSVTHTRPTDQSGIDWGACPGFSPAAAAYAQYLTNSNWGWLSRTNSVMQQALQPVSNAAFPSMIGIPVPNQIPNAAVGQQVLVKNFRRINVKQPRLNGIWTIGVILPPVAPATTWTYFLNNSGAVPLANYKTLGQFGLLSFIFNSYVAFAWDVATERKRGGTIGRPRGRSRSRI